ncbi:DUF6080 domain-containing protein [Paenibacillus dakarensis]|uniref:DUF6080 domain-containing protein n=1 Tax=Paenibacillus dakarensis TaxID=1527293 RepID=UPI0006D5A210|nr:DUF6080 domain-containing protein [Paenibacillus dakarensis]
MTFRGYFFKDRKDNYTALILWLVFCLFYLVMNMPYIQYIKDNAEMLGRYNPFYGAPFSLNLFNFDPSMEYGSTTGTVIHPLYNFLSAPLTHLSSHSIGNMLFLIVQAVMNALTTTIIYFMLRRSGSDRHVSLLFTALFGVSSYSIFTAFIPDSYPYAQFVIVLSAAYLQKCRAEQSFPIIPNASLTLLNFGITSTNVVTFAVALFVSLFNRSHTKTTFKWFMIIMITALMMILMMTGIQYFTFGKTWLTNVFGGLSSGGLGYVTPFSVEHHARAFYMLIVSPILTPAIALIDTGITAFATDLSKPYPLYVHIVGIGFFLMAVLGFIKGIKSRGIWAIFTYILFAFLLHIVVGFGLTAFTYDLYLYAGHYLFAFFILAASFVTGIRNHTAKKVLLGVAAVFLLVTAANNMIKHQSNLDYIHASYTNVLTQQDSDK